MLNTNPKTKGKKVDKELLFCIAVLAIPLLQFLIFYIIVNFNSFLMAFQKATFNYGEVSYSFAGLDNFKELWKDLTETNVLRSALKNSLITWFFTSLMGISSSVIFSYYIFKKGWGGSFFRLILFLPSILPAILLAAIFQSFVDTVLPKLFDINPLFVLGEGTAFPMALVFSLWFGFGMQVLLYNGTMEQISPSVLEAAQLDGATPIIELWKIVIPEILPAIATFLIAGIATIFTNQAGVYGFHGPDALNYEGEYTLGYWMYTKVQGGESNYTYASAVGLCCTMIALPVTLLVKRLLIRKEA